jgi:malate synthase
MEIFDRLMPEANQIGRSREDVAVSAEDLLRRPDGAISEAGFRQNITVAVRYMASWLNGNGCVPIHNLMEDAATAEISRAQIWQWIRHPDGRLEDGREITMSLYESIRDDEMAALKSEVGEQFFAEGKYAEAASLLDSIIRQEEFAEFLTLAAYDALD